MKYDFKPMEWNELVGYWSSTNHFCTWYIDKITFKMHVWDNTIEEYTYEHNFNTLDEAKAAAEKHRQGLIKQLGGVKI